MSFFNSLRYLQHHRLIIVFLLGFSAGLPLALTSTTLQSWFTVSGISVVTIGLLGLIGQPYIYKLFWAPLLDYIQPPILGYRRGWMLLMQLGVVFFLTLMAFLNPVRHALLLGVLALLTAFFSATQDIAIDAYRTDVLSEKERGLGAAFYTGGYRLAMLISGGVALILAERFGWQFTYLCMASLMVVGMVAACFGPEVFKSNSAPATFTDAIIQPFQQFISRKAAWRLLLFIIFYKLCDAFILNMLNPFLLNGLHFSLSEVGLATKTIGLIAILVGVFLGGAILNKLGVFRALLGFGVLQAFSSLLFMLLAMWGKNYWLMYAAVATENLTNGMCSAAFLVLLMQLCDHRYTATQYALFSALAAICRVFVGPIAGLMVDKAGWPGFFLGVFILAWPALVMLMWLRGEFFSRHSQAMVRFL